jgi:hypothetical protein
MKHLKIVLAIAAAAALMAFIGAGTASADVICTTNTNPCTSKITTLTGSITGSGSLKDTSNNEFATCTVASISGEITAQGLGINPSGPVNSLTWGAKGAGCNTTVDTVKSGRVELRTEGGSSVVWAMETEITLVAFGVSCTYGANGTGTKLGVVTTGANATITANAVVNKTAGSFLCPSTTRLTGEGIATNHSAVFVTTE